MKILLWHCMDATNANFMKNMRTLMEYHNPTILALTEKRMEDHNKILQPLDLTDVIQVPALGYSKGISLLWRNSEITTKPFVLIEQEIHTFDEVSTSFPKWYISIIYAKNCQTQEDTMGNLRSIATKINEHWLVCGDFNEITSASIKLWGDL